MKNSILDGANKLAEEESALTIESPSAVKLPAIDNAGNSSLLVNFRGDGSARITLCFWLCLMALILCGLPAIILQQLYHHLSIGEALNITGLCADDLFFVLYLTNVSSALPALAALGLLTFTPQLISSAQRQIELSEDGIRQISGARSPRSLLLTLPFRTPLKKLLPVSKANPVYWDCLLAKLAGGLPTQKPLPWQEIHRVIVSERDFPERVSIIVAPDLEAMTNDRRRQTDLNLESLSLKERQQLISRLCQSVPPSRIVKQRCNPGLARFFHLTHEKPVAKPTAKRSIPFRYTDIWFGAVGNRSRSKIVDILPPGTKLQNGRIQICDAINGGGLSNVYLAKMRDEGQGETPVVVKEFIRLLDDDEESYDEISAGATDSSCFRRERAVLSRLHHPAIVRMFDSFIEDRIGYLVLEYIEGTTIQNLVEREGAIEEGQILSWAIELCSVLKYLHGTLDVIHRDFTPHNMMLTTSGLKLIDFNAAQPARAAHREADDVVGKPGYISPEQFRGRATTQSDIYALGATMFYMLTGEEAMPISQSHPKSINVKVSEELDRIVARATALDINQRYADADELMADLLLNTCGQRFESSREGIF